MVYTDRIILFMDLLGFREIVNKTAEHPDFLNDIYEVLHSITSVPISAEAFNIFDYELRPRKPKNDLPHQELLMTVYNSSKEISDWTDEQALERKAMSSLAVTHFSDSLVVSADITDEISVSGLIELAAKVNYRLWREHNILTRGGITVGKLIHEESGALVGPAMVRAYEIESTLAVYPRILIDQSCVALINKIGNSTKFTHLFKLISEPIINQKKGTQLTSGLEINLATSYAYLQHGPFAGSPGILKRYDRSLKASVPRLREIRQTLSDERVIKKYDYIINELDEYSKNYPFWDEL